MISRKTLAYTAAGLSAGIVGLGANLQGCSSFEEYRSRPTMFNGRNPDYLAVAIDLNPKKSFLSWIMRGDYEGRIEPEIVALLDTRVLPAEKIGIGKEYVDPQNALKNSQYNWKIYTSQKFLDELKSNEETGGKLQRRLEEILGKNFELIPLPIGQEPILGSFSYTQLLPQKPSFPYSNKAKQIEKREK